jgi:putative Holliday junction resolvase
MAKGKILAIDYGGAKVGLAVSDADRQMAFGRGVLRNLSKEQLISQIFDMINKEAVVELLIGLPLGPDGEETEQTQKIRYFGSMIGKSAADRGVELVINYTDESFSTFEANQRLIQMGIKPADRKATEDEMSAIILLQRYIDFRP